MNRSALNAWKVAWQRAAESSLNPQNPDGPIPFTSSALLALAYIRIHVNLGPHRELETRDPFHIANSLWNSPPVRRSPQLIPALLHSVHSLSIPVKLGIDYVAQSQTFFWSIQHSICGLECAMILSKWLCEIGISHLESPLTRAFCSLRTVFLADLTIALEQRVLRWTEYLVTESGISANQPFNDSADSFQSSVHSTNVAILRLWGRVFCGNQLWAIVSCIGQSLVIYANMLDDRHGN
jgi:hypothetical protein